MRSKTAILSVFVLTALPMMAGALPPCVKAVSSANANFLVVTSMEYQPHDRSKVHQVTLEIFPKETFINAKDRVFSQSVFWTNWPQWSVVLNSSNTRSWVSACPVSLITNDGEFLVIVNTGVFAGDSALRIFRRRDHVGDPVREGPDHGVLVRDIPLRQLLPASKLSEGRVINDESPQWFAGGTFEFSADSRVLVHKTPWGTSVLISLTDGSVSTH